MNTKHKDFIDKGITINEAISALGKIKNEIGGDMKLHIQSDGCCRNNHPAWIVDCDEELKEVVIRG